MKARHPQLTLTVPFSSRCPEDPEGGLKVILHTNAFQVLFPEIASRHLVRLYYGIPFHGRERTRSAISSGKHAIDLK